MEKFAVDLDKVLDEFEFNEDRAEQLANVLPKRRPVSAAPNNQPRRQNPPPPYRRPPFEPVVLADADFAAADVPQSWNVRNTLRRPNGSETDSDCSEADVDETARSGGLYDNNSFRDEELAGRGPAPVVPDWPPSSRDNKNKANKVSGVFSSLDEYVNAGSGSRVNVKDVKTVSNDLSVNKIKNLDKNDGRNLIPDGKNLILDDRNLIPGGKNLIPDDMNLIPGGKNLIPDGKYLIFDERNLIPDGRNLIPNGMKLVPDGGNLIPDGKYLIFDERNLIPDGKNLIPDVRNLIPDGKNLIPDVRNLIPDERNLPDVASTSNRPPLRNPVDDFDLPNGTFDLVTNLSGERDPAIVTCGQSEASGTSGGEILEVENVNDVGAVEPETVPAKPVICFGRGDDPSEAALLAYLHDIERELDEGGAAPPADDPLPSPPTRPSDDGDLTRNLDLFCDRLQSKTALGDQVIVTEDQSEGAIQNPAVQPDSRLDSKDSTESLSGEYKSMHSAIHSELCGKDASNGDSELAIQNPAVESDRLNSKDSSRDRTEYKSMHSAIQSELCGKEASQGDSEPAVESDLRLDSKDSTESLSGEYKSMHSAIQSELCSKEESKGDNGPVIRNPAVESDCRSNSKDSSQDRTEYKSMHSAIQSELCGKEASKGDSEPAIQNPAVQSDLRLDSKDSLRDRTEYKSMHSAIQSELCGKVASNGDSELAIQNPAVVSDSRLNSKDSTRDRTEYKSMHSAIQSELCGKEASKGDGGPAIRISPREAIAGDPSTNEEGSSPESDRPCLEELDSDLTSTEDGDEGPISARTAATLETQADAKRRPPIVEVRSPMVQTPRDGSAIHVLGEEERPTRPKYLFLPSKITVGGGTAEGEASSDDETLPSSQVGPAGATPHAYPCNPSIAEATDNRPSLEENQNVINANETAYNNANRPTTDETTAGGDDNRPTAERLDNRANVDPDGDADLSSPDFSESSAETMSPTPLAADRLPALTNEDRTLGFVSPFWIPDNEASACMLCDVRFTVLRRRHHCRACGKVLCSKCCGLKARLEYMDNAEGRVCQPCHDILLRVLLEEHGEVAGSPTHSATQGRQPHPNNPMDYCSTIPPLQQVAGALHNPTPSVLVPVGVLKRQGSARPKSDVAKQVMFSDGIRPGGDLTELDGSGEARVPFRRPGRVAKRVATPPGPQTGASPRSPLPGLDPKTLSYIPSDRGLPPVATLIKGELKLDGDMDEDILLTALRDDSEPPVMFAVNRNLYVHVKILNLSCCVNRLCWCFTTQGLRCVSQDEIMLVLETIPNELTAPRDVFCYFNTLYQDAVKGSTVSDLGCTLLTGPFLGSTDHGAFVYIRPSFQCLRRFALPTAPYLVAILVHRSETPWARVFPIRLVLRLGAEFRYYPCSLVSVRNRKSVYREIGHTIMNLLADFRNLSYTLPSVRGLVIHMEDRRTSILLPRNRYDQVTRALNNSNEHVLALAANLSLTADSHLVCVQSEGDLGYHTQAINIHSKPRRVTGASFVVFNGALKTSANLTAKSSIVEDGLMVQITPDTMLALRGAMRNMKDWSVGCGPTGAATPDETVSVQWVDDDRNFNVGVCSVIDGRSLDGVPSIRVHNGTDYLGRSRLVRWTEVFILKSDEGGRTGDPLDVGRLSESIARAVCHGLVKLLDLLAQADYGKFAIRASIHPDSVCYEGGSRGEVLPPIYMNSLDNELVPVLHTAATANENTSTMLELVFHVLLQ